MSIQFSSSTLQFSPSQNELQYIVKCIPASESIKITVEGAFEIALGTNINKNFGKELILLPDTTTTPHKIERIIIVKKLLPLGKGTLIHTIANQNEKYSIGLEAGADNKPISTEISKPEIPNPQSQIPNPKPPIPSFSFTKTNISFGKVAPGIAKIQSFSIVSQQITKYTLEVSLPFKLSLDNKTFVNSLTVEPNVTQNEKQIFCSNAVIDRRKTQAVYLYSCAKFTR